MAKTKNFEKDFPSTQPKGCDGLTQHRWKVITAVKDANATEVSGICWCTACGAIAQWNNNGPNREERITEITLTANNPQ